MLCCLGFVKHFGCPIRIVILAVDAYCFTTFDKSIDGIYADAYLVACTALQGYNIVLVLEVFVVILRIVPVLFLVLPFGVFKARFATIVFARNATIVTATLAEVFLTLLAIDAIIRVDISFPTVE